MDRRRWLIHEITTRKLYISLREKDVKQLNTYYNDLPFKKEELDHLESIFRELYPDDEFLKEGKL